MLRSLLIFAFGVFVGQEYGSSLPNIKLKTYEMFDNFKETDLYKKLNEDFKRGK